MAKIVVYGGNRLQGHIKLAGNKNSALELIPASLLADTPVTLTNVPRIRDVEIMLKIVEKLGVKVSGKGTDTITIDPRNLSSYQPDEKLSERFRASVVLASPLLAKFGKAMITPPGGDQIGERLLDTHFSMMKKLGVVIKKKDGKYLLTWKHKKATKVFLDESSVTATGMGMILASNIEEEVVIDDAATEPHLKDLATFLNRMGAEVVGAGTHSVLIKGKRILSGTEHKVVPDHIEGGTFAIAAAVTAGNILIEDFIPDDYQMILYYLSNLGVKTKIGENTLEILPSKLIAFKRKFQTRPWPGFPTDLMSPFIVLATQATGTILCHDWMYEWRIYFVDDLISMGANIFIADPHRVIVTGPTRLRGDKLYCKDIRAGMSIILAALSTKEESSINNIEVVERGYENLESRLRSLGAQIERFETNGNKA